MTNFQNPDNIIQAAMRLVESNENSNIRLNANGGNSILIVCEPDKELEYIKAINKLMKNNKYEVIDLNNLLNEFITQNKADIEDSFELLKGSIHQIFKIPNGEEGSDLFTLVIKAIAGSLQDKKVPVLINSGALYGSGIDNIHIMENELIMQASLPLIILYPATREKDKLMFLGNRPASKYRCMIVG
jgi:hypothetical protein